MVIELLTTSGGGGNAGVGSLSLSRAVNGARVDVVDVIRTVVVVVVAL